MPLKTRCRRDPLQAGRCLAAAIVLLAAAALLAQTTVRPDAQRFEEAVRLLEVKGDSAAALKTFDELSKSHDRALAARALVYLGVCYERVGRAQAENKYREVIEKYPEQAAAVRDARARLAALANSSRTVMSLVPTIRKAWTTPAPGDIWLTSRNGRLLAYRRDLEGGDVVDIVVADTATGEIQRRFAVDEGSDAGPTRPVPSPDGRQVVYTWVTRGQPTEVRMASSDGAKPRVLFRARAGETPYVWGWSSSGRLLVAIESEQPGVQLSLVSAVDGRTRLLATLDPPPGFLSLSPDDRLVAFDRPSKPGATDSDILVLSAADGEVRPVATGAWNDSMPMWAPDGLRLLFVSNRTGTDSLCALPFAGGRPSGPVQVLQESLGRVQFALGITASGDYYYWRQVGLVDVYGVSLGEDGRPAGKPESFELGQVGDNLMPAFRPTAGGGVLTFLASMGAEIGIVNEGHTAEGRISTGGISGARAPKWSPDGRLLLLRGSDAAGRYGMHVLDVDTGRVSPILLESDTRFGMVRWAHRGAAVLYQSPGADGSQTLRRRELGTMADVEVMRVEGPDPMMGFGVSPVDGSLVLARGGKASSTLELWSPGGKSRVLVRVTEPDLLGANPVWMPDGRHIVFPRITPAAGRPELWRVDVESGRSESMGIAMAGLRDVAVRPDGRQLAFTAGWPRREVWVLTNFLPAATTVGQAQGAKRRAP